jgi:hypothetical protein
MMLFGLAIIGWGCSAEPSGSAHAQGGNAGTATAPSGESGGSRGGSMGGSAGNGGAGGQSSTGGSAGEPSSGGAAGASPGGTGGGSPGSGGAAAGGSADAGAKDGRMGDSGADASAGSADARPGQTGGSGGQGGSGVPGSGGTGTGGSQNDASVGKDAAAPDATPDAVAPDLAPIPDAPVRLDAPTTFWTTSYTANCTPPAIGGRAQTDGHHRAGEDCMRSGCHLNPKKPEHHAGTDCRGSGCHANGSPDGSGAPAFVFGGTVYRAATLAADPGVQVAVKTTAATYSACSASNGNFWTVAPSTAVSWTGASARLRNGNGEAAMMTAVAAGCNATACHSGTLKMTSP